ncbi:GGDEF domain-containing protein [Nocardioides ultimimeridianus]
MDVATLRIAFAMLAAVLVVLFYAAAYRPTRAPFSGWWTLALTLFLCSAVAFLGNGTHGQAVLNPLGSGLAVAGAEAAWCGARSLHTRPLPRRLLLVGPALAVIAGALDDPAHNTWAGGLTFLVLMSAGFAGASLEMRAAARSLTERTTDRRETDGQGLLVLVAALRYASGLLAVYYAARAAAYLWVGPFSHTFTTYFGAGPTTLLLIIQLATVSFSMSSLSTLQQLADLRQRALYDQLTGLMRAQEFRRYAAAALPHLARQGEVTVAAMVDFDHFKDVNDQLGHRAGDDVLRALGHAAQATVGRAGICGRLGGDEFALLFPAASVDDAERQLDAMVEAFERSVHLSDGRIPTFSIGIAPATDDTSIATLLDRADQALYRAKRSGRNCAVRG